MSLWNDIRDAFTAPIRGFASFVAAPINVTAQLVSGDSLKSIIDNQFQNVSQLNITNNLVTSQSGSDILRSKTADKLTLGVSTNYQGSVSTQQKATQLKFQEITKQDLLETGRTGLVVGAAVAAPALLPTQTAAAISSPLTTYATGQVAKSALDSGNIIGAASALGGGSLIPSDVADAYNAIAPFVPVPGDQGPAGPIINDPYRYVGDNAAINGLPVSTEQAGVGAGVALVALSILYLALRKK